MGQLAARQEFLNYKAVAVRLGTEIPDSEAMATLALQATGHLRTLAIHLSKLEKAVGEHKSLKGADTAPSADEILQLSAEKIWNSLETLHGVRQLLSAPVQALQVTVTNVANQVKQKLADMDKLTQGFTADQPTSWKNGLSPEATLDVVLQAAKVLSEKTDGQAIKKANKALKKAGRFW